MLVATEPRRFGKHKIYHIIFQEVRKSNYLNHLLDLKIIAMTLELKLCLSNFSRGIEDKKNV